MTAIGAVDIGGTKLLRDQVEVMTIQLHCPSPKGLYTSSAELGSDLNRAFRLGLPGGW